MDCRLKLTRQIQIDTQVLLLGLLNKLPCMKSTNRLAAKGLMYFGAVAPAGLQSCFRQHPQCKLARFLSPSCPTQAIFLSTFLSGMLD